MISKPTLTEPAVQRNHVGTPDEIPRLVEKSSRQLFAGTNIRLQLDPEAARIGYPPVGLRRAPNAIKFFTRP